VLVTAPPGRFERIFGVVVLLISLAAAAMTITYIATVLSTSDNPADNDPLAGGIAPASIAAVLLIANGIWTAFLGCDVPPAFDVDAEAARAPVENGPPGAEATAMSTLSQRVLAREAKIHDARTGAGGRLSLVTLALALTVLAVVSPRHLNDFASPALLAAKPHRSPECSIGPLRTCCVTGGDSGVLKTNRALGLLCASVALLAIAVLFAIFLATAPGPVLFFALVSSVLAFAALGLIAEEARAAGATLGGWFAASVAVVGVLTFLAAVAALVALIVRRKVGMVVRE
jgi:hypothetical protein